ncbi:uncharacterized protein LOC141914432 [Tubulanus polymorphus]|uniref:uncharacterized protein LOC141901479 n=1 Tax=Tubulanus polymorphus TaxID=672921 RepID=UPI003DA6B0B5
MGKDELIVPGLRTVWINKNSGDVEANAVCLAEQVGDLDVYLAVADCEHGRVPGKAAKMDGVYYCWYGVEGKEHCTTNFWWVCATAEMELKKADDKHTPKKPLATGFMLDGTGVYFSVVANTPYGTIPGKISANSDKCTYPYGGEDHETDDFSYVTWDD